MKRSTGDRPLETGQALDCHYRFILWLIPTLARFPRSQKFLLGDRMQNTAIDILEALIEATYTKDRDGTPCTQKATLSLNAGLEHGEIAHVLI